LNLYNGTVGVLAASHIVKPIGVGVYRRDCFDAPFFPVRFTNGQAVDTDFVAGIDKKADLAN
jgi:hypothetical protein